jgi:hypothetical protein
VDKAQYPDYEQSGNGDWAKRFVATLSGAILLAFVGGCLGSTDGDPPTLPSLRDMSVDYQVKPDASEELQATHDSTNSEAWNDASQDSEGQRKEK